MKKHLSFIAALMCLASVAQAQQPTVTETLFDRSKYEDTFAFGADISWLTQQEQWGTVYRNRMGEPTELMQILQSEQGINAVRFRVWVNPRGGWSGKQDVINLCKRAHAKGLKIMLGFHYSDSWADPEKQNIPAEWTDRSLEALCRNIYEHTFDVLSSLKAVGITPQWVQIGNETDTGMLWETGRTGTKQGYKNFAAMINSGYRAIKDVDPGIQAIVHLSNAHDNKFFRDMLDHLKKYKAQWDILGMSAYPHWSKLSVATPDSLASTLGKYMTNIRDMKRRYGKPVIVVETGHYGRKPLESNQFLAEFMRQLIAEGVLGCFFWEPESMGGYELGAWDAQTHQATIAMDAFKGIRHRAVSTEDETMADTAAVISAKTGCLYKVRVAFTGRLMTGRVNVDLDGYELGRQERADTAEFVIPCTTGRIDLWAETDSCFAPRISYVSAEPLPAKQKRAKRKVHHIGDSTSAGNGAWARRLAELLNEGKYPELAALCDFCNDGQGGKQLRTLYTIGRLASVLRDICPGDIVIVGNVGTNNMNRAFEEDLNFYLNVAEQFGAKVMLNSYSPHGAVARWAKGYDAETQRFDSYRRDAYDMIIRRVAEERAATDPDFVGFVEIGKNADAAFNAYVDDFARNGYASRQDAAEAITHCYADHNHYHVAPLACDLMLNGYGEVEGIVAQLVRKLKK